MAYQSRSQYELGDPAFDAIAKAETTDHYKATARARRLLLLADHVVGVLDAQGLIGDPATVRAEVFHALADDLYGTAAIDLPDFRSTDSLDALRRGRYPDADDAARPDA